MDYTKKLSGEKLWYFLTHIIRSWISPVKGRIHGYETVPNLYYYWCFCPLTENQDFYIGNKSFSVKTDISQFSCDFRKIMQIMEKHGESWEIIGIPGNS